MNTNGFQLPSPNVILAKKCLALIRDIATRGTNSDNTEFIAYAIQELSQVIFERTGNSERMFEPMTVEVINDLEELYEELAWVESFSQSMSASRNIAGAVNIPRTPCISN